MVDSTTAVTLERAALRRAVLPARLIAAVVVIVVLLLAAAAWFAGVRAFVVDSPSMGTAAPVGSLVIGTAGAEARVGDLITFQPPSRSSAPYTHRIVGTTGEGFHTRGDINGASDPWLVTPSMVIARATAVVPGLGWLVRAAPFMLGALVCAQVIGLFVRAPALRWSIRTAAVAVGFAAASWAVKPFTGFVLLQSSAEADGLRATVVSTALLPVRIQAFGGGHVDLLAGQVGRLVLPRHAHGRVTMVSQLDLEPAGWVLLVVCCLLPLFVVLIRGVPVEERNDAET